MAVIEYDIMEYNMNIYVCIHVQPKSCFVLEESRSSFMGSAMLQCLHVSTVAQTGQMRYLIGSATSFMHINHTHRSEVIDITHLTGFHPTHDEM